MVVFNVWGNNTCWYPMGWRHRWRNDHWTYAGNHNGPPRGGGVRPVVVPRDPKDPKDLSGRKENPGEFEDNVPPGGIVAIDTAKFGTGAKPVRPPADVAKGIIARKDNLDRPVLPDYKDITGRITRDIKADKPKIIDDPKGAKTGAAIRKPNAPLDNDLRETTIFGGRKPPTPAVTPAEKPTDSRKPGVFTRPPVEVKEPPTTTKVTPKYTPPTVNETPRYVPPPVKETPRYIPPTTQKETPRYTPPSPPVKPAERPKETPPVKTEPKPEAKPKPTPAPRKDDGSKSERDKP